MPELELRPSHSSCWLTCTASTTIDVSDVEEPAKPYRERGTKLHEIAEICLRDPTWEPSVDLNDVTEDDLASVKTYVDYVRGLEGFKFYEVEAEFVPGLEGTADAAVFAPAVAHARPATLEIVDYKAGYVFVDPEENTQLTIYALAVARKFESVFDVERVKLTIVQPAAENLSSWELTRAQLEKRGKKIARIVERIRESDTDNLEFVPGEKQCRWCLAKTRCPALREHVDKVAADDFRGADDLSLEEKMDLIPLLRGWCGAVEAEARSKLLSGESVSGWKVVRGKRGARKWKNPTRVAEFLRKKWKLEPAQIFKPGTMLSPAGIEKLVKGDEERPKERLKRFIEEGAAGAPTVVPESDSRKELTKAELAKDDFANLNDEED